MADEEEKNNQKFPLPRDYIMCRGRYMKMVVACMHNCREPNFCASFWNFFSQKDISPKIYYNYEEIGDKVMRRIVIDCDRCGKREIDTVYSLYNKEGEGEEFLLPEEERLQMVEDVGYGAHKEGFNPVVDAIFKYAEQEKKWVHYCQKCFQAINDSIGKALKIESSIKTTKKISKKAKKEDKPDKPETEIAKVKTARKGKKKK